MIRSTFRYDSTHTISYPLYFSYHLDFQTQGNLEGHMLKPVHSPCLLHYHHQSLNDCVENLSYTLGLWTENSFFVLEPLYIYLVVDLWASL